jgi:hypothetical protein
MTGEPEHDTRKGAPAPPPDPGDEDEDEGASPFGLFPILILVVLVVGGLFLIFKLHDMATIQDCVSSGRKNCAPISVPNER